MSSSWFWIKSSLSLKLTPTQGERAQILFDLNRDDSYKVIELFKKNIYVVSQSKISILLNKKSKQLFELLWWSFDIIINISLDFHPSIFYHITYVINSWLDYSFFHLVFLAYNCDFHVVYFLFNRRSTATKKLRL